MWGSVLALMLACGCGRIAFDSQITGDTASVDVAIDSALRARSCETLTDTCGPTGDRSCCESPLIPGGSFFRLNDVSGEPVYSITTFPATVSPFRLDAYEVTVGRFRAFVEAGGGTQAQPPSDGDGAHANIPGSGWDAAWNTSLAVDAPALYAALKCHGGYQTWTDSPGANEQRPIACVTWFEAMAFCAWDGGFLPTEAQMLFATSGGDEQRSFPWSSPPDSLAIDCTFVNYGRAAFPSTACVSSGAAPVGISPQGDGRYGQADLGGNLAEWALDWHESTLPMPCDDCANLTTSSTGNRTVRDGSFIAPESEVRSAYRDRLAPAMRHPFYGVRCARPL